MSDLVVRVERRYAAPAERVFDAWLDPAWIGRFMFGPHLREEAVVSLDNDPRVGGQFHYVVERAGQRLDHTGTYRVIDRPQRLSFSWGVGGEQGDLSVVTIKIAPDGEGCALALTHRLAPDWAAYPERTKAGWTKILEDLAAALP